MAPSVRRRLSPEDRRNQLLDCARSVIVNQGLSGLTMEKLATVAGVSNPLIYKYFDTRLQVLQHLLVREYTVFSASITKDSEISEDIGSYRHAVRGYVDINFRQFAGGDVLGILLGQPDVRQAIDTQEKSRHAPFFIKQLAKEYKIRRGLAQRILALASGASIAAAENYGKFGGNREQQIDQTVSFIFAGIEALVRAKNSG